MTRFITLIGATIPFIVYDRCRPAPAAPRAAPVLRPRPTGGLVHSAYAVIGAGSHHDRKARGPAERLRPSALQSCLRRRSWPRDDASRPRRTPGRDAVGRADDEAARRAGQPQRGRGKGRPTPKRSEAERRRRPYSAPGDRKEAKPPVPRAPAPGRAPPSSRRMQRGEQWALPARDRGPVKALARDYVDSRRRLSEFYMYGLLRRCWCCCSCAARGAAHRPGAVLVAMILIMLVEGDLHRPPGARAGRAALARGEHPGACGCTPPCARCRSAQLRMPKPRVKPGADAV